MSTLVNDMSHESHWSNEEAVTNYLSQQLLLGRLAIFLGSGVSFNFNLPNWAGLIGALCKIASIDFPPIGYPEKVTLLQIASSLRRGYFENSDDKFVEAVATELYRSADVAIERLCEDRLFAAIGATLTSSARGGVSTVLTLNYDDCLERYLEILGFVVDPIINPSHWASRADISIMHPHGFLPYDRARSRSSEIVLDQTSFSNAIGNVGSLWFQRIVGVLRTSTTLLIGLGTGDQNLLSMLKAAKTDHPSENDGAKYNCVMVQVDPNRMAAESIKDHGVSTFPLRDNKTHLPDFLLSICQKAAVTRRAQLCVDIRP